MHLERIRFNKIWIWCEHVGLVMNLAYKPQQFIYAAFVLMTLIIVFDSERHFDPNQEHLLHVLFG